MHARSGGVREALERLHAAAGEIPRPVQFMEVCGTHTMSAFRSGLHSLLPENVTLLSGPGCPVCVTAQSDIDLMIELGAAGEVILCTYGDMMRVPGARGSLQDARGAGADIRVVYSAVDAVRAAQAHPARQVVFAAVGFETTAPATAAAILRADQLGLDNFSVLVSHKRIGPALLGLLETGTVNIDGFLCPGHVSVIVGTAPYRPVVERFGLPCVISGFEAEGMAAALAQLCELVRDGAAQLVNVYPQAVRDEGNLVALAMMERVFAPADVRWRGLGVIAGSGLAIRDQFARFDALRRFGQSAAADREPKSCRCGEVITGRATPRDCALFATACTPINPIGPCMVSSEGTCQAWFKYQRGAVPRVQVAARDAAREVLA